MNKPLLTSLASLSLLTTAAAAGAQQPNIILIMCDDMGFSDLGCYGSEINTPNIDKLAEEGVRFTQFKNTGRSCPSRASLLTGRYQHSVGMGWMTAVNEHRPGYYGELTDAVPTVAELLKGAGYSTYMSGKWHVTGDEAYPSAQKENFGPNGSFPTERGFDKYYGALSGGGNYYTPKPLMRDDKLITEYADDFYYTHEITKDAVKNIDNHNADEPLFMYVAHYAPHRPLQAPQERIDAVKERYAVGYDVLKAKRFARQQEMGIVPEADEMPLHTAEYKNNERPSWESLNEQEREAWIKDISTFAAMVEIVDDGIGELVEATKRKGIYENTIFIFLSDNGATIEGDRFAQYTADLCNTPYRSYKKWCFMGGTSSPLIIHSPKLLGEYNGEVRTTPAHINDLLPTCIDFAGVDYPKRFNGEKITPPDGVSIVPVAEGKQIKSRDLFFEHQTSCAVISDGWKLVRATVNDEWELFNLSVDPFETNDLSAAEPKRRNQLEAKWTKWAEENDVFPLETLLWTPRIKHYKALYKEQQAQQK
ncbi:MAG: arylsulfatase [Rikenellaceae bacterium]